MEQFKNWLKLPYVLWIDWNCPMYCDMIETALCIVNWLKLPYVLWIYQHPHGNFPGCMLFTNIDTVIVYIKWKLLCIDYIIISIFIKSLLIEYGSVVLNSFSTGNSVFFSEKVSLATFLKLYNQILLVFKLFKYLFCTFKKIPWV